MPCSPDTVLWLRMAAIVSDPGKKFFNLFPALLRQGTCQVGQHAVLPLPNTCVVDDEMVRVAGFELRYPPVPKAGALPDLRHTRVVRLKRPAQQELNPETTDLEGQCSIRATGGLLGAPPREPW